MLEEHWTCLSWFVASIDGTWKTSSFQKLSDLLEGFLVFPTVGLLPVPGAALSWPMLSHCWLSLLCNIHTSLFFSLRKPFKGLGEFITYVFNVCIYFLSPPVMGFVVWFHVSSTQMHERNHAEVRGTALGLTQFLALPELLAYMAEIKIADESFGKGEIQTLDVGAWETKAILVQSRNHFQSPFVLFYFRLWRCGIPWPSHCTAPCLTGLCSGSTTHSSTPRTWRTTPR